MELINPDFATFEDLAGRFNRVPVFATLICDDLTPVSAFARLQADQPHAFLLESVVGGEKIARYSFLGADPAATFSATREAVRIVDQRADTAQELMSEDPLAELQRLVHSYRAAPLPGLPRFLGGAVGYAAYDTVRYFERLPHPPQDDRGLPDLFFDLYETMVVFDHVRKTVLVVALAAVEPGQGGADLRKAYEEAVERVTELTRRLSRRMTMPPVRVRLPAPRPTSNGTPATSTSRPSSAWSKAARSTSAPATSSRWCCRSG